LIRDLDAEAESDESLGWEAAIHALLISAEFRYLP